ncbi:chromosome segregation protein SMC [uncultured Mobiluncus sp.]|uniref:chromosome segregation protein SMC n=1 Tax=uncultured Mobiluncus sp. TaxID=293425 RepID=UPI002803FD0B|nr:chromosome segregation protein SMC [uncultured Mobiluncus sp.]
MYLKSLTLKGFKSFANTVHMNLEPGVTCVVGPNGSGKSNVVDALAWVMGEQGAKNLRGSQMSDVIFAGTKTKAPLGRAEVQLTIDNTDGALPIEYSEVTISRTMFRAGGSEYAINGTPVRLLDIQELLSDTGMGREMHVIVGQGQLDRILSASELERRAFIEEAAGVLKHRQRKDRALKKLESLAVNLSRVQDLTSEVAKRLGPLGKQAEAARKAARVQAELADATARLIADAVAQNKEKAGSQTASKEQISAQIVDLEARLQGVNTKLNAAKSSFDEVSPELEKLTQTWAELSTLAERLEALANQARERANALRETAELTRTADTSELEKRLDKTREEISEKQAAAAKADDAVTQTQAAEERAKEREVAVRSQIEKLQRAQADRRETLERLRGAVATAASLAEEAAGNLSRMEEALQAAAQRETACAQELSKVEAELPPGVADGTLAAREEKLAAAVATIQAKVSQLSTELGEAREEAAFWEAKREVLAKTLQPEDAAGAVAKAGLSGVSAALLETILVQAGWEDAIGAVFGKWSKALLTSGVESAADALRFVRQQSAGQVHLLVADGVGTPFGARTTASLENAKLPDGVCWAKDLVSARKGKTLPPVVAALLTGVAACPDLSEARDLVLNGEVAAAVTQAGDFLSATRIVGGGDPDAGILRRASEYDEAAAQAEAAAAAADKADGQLAQAKTELAAAQEEYDAAAAQLKAQDAAAAAATAAVAAAKAKRGAAQAEVERAGKHLEQARAETEKRQAALHEAQETLDASLKAQDTGTDDEPDFSTELQAAMEAVSTAQTAKSDAHIAAHLARQELESLESRAASLQRNIAAEKAAAQAAASRALVRERRRKRSVYVMEQAEAAQRLAHAAAASAQAQRQASTASREQLQTEMETLRAAVDDLSRQRTDLKDASMRDEVALAEVNSKLARLLEQAQQECGLDETTLLTQYGPHNLVPVFDEAGETIEHVPFVRVEQVERKAQAQTELKRIGKVNPLALQEHEALVARHKFLADQVADLNKSREDLMNVVAEVDRQVEDVFGKAFADVRAAFTDIFQVLFPGGEGRLTLSDPRDLLNTGIEIEARPAGKNVKRMSLLSGGERSLAALAFLFAIFQARPSPFYVLDEVEAALDDVNLSRLLGVFEILRENSQLIIITHHKRTMEIADALYGVTMKEGTTAVISQRLVKTPGENEESIP